MSAARARLMPEEVRRRRAALERYLRNSAATPDGAIRAADRPMADRLSVSSLYPSPAGLPRPAIFCGGVVTLVNYGDALRWAVSQGLAPRRGPMNLRAVNAARRAAGLFPFALRGEG